MSQEPKKDSASLITKLYDFHYNYFASLFDLKKINHIVINGIEDEPYVANISFILNAYTSELLKMMDTLASILNIDDVKIAVKNTDTTNIEKYLSKIGTYPKIKLSLLEDRYLIGKDFFLLENLNLSSDDTVIINVNDLYNMYNSYFYDKYPYDTFVTISGNVLHRSYVFKIKIGTKLTELLDNFIKDNLEGSKCIVNGLMTGYEANVEDVVIGEQIKAIFFLKDEKIESSHCNNCGICNKFCPVKVNPKKIMDSKKISKYCLDCGLCTYLCPCHINLRKYLRGEYE